MAQSNTGKISLYGKYTHDWFDDLQYQPIVKFRLFKSQKAAEIFPSRIKGKYHAVIYSNVNGEYIKKECNSMDAAKQYCDEIIAKAGLQVLHKHMEILL